MPTGWLKKGRLRGTLLEIKGIGCGGGWGEGLRRVSEILR